MAAPRRKFENVDVALPDGESVRVGTHQAEDGTVTLKLRLPGEWNIEQLFRGAQQASKTVLVVAQENQ